MAQMHRGWTDYTRMEKLLWAVGLNVAIGLVCISYWESYWGLRRWANDPLWPLTLDAPGLVSALFALVRRGEDRYAVWVAAIFGAALVVGNIVSEYPNPKEMIIHAIPPVTMLTVFHLVVREVTPRRSKHSPAPSDPSVRPPGSVVGTVAKTLPAAPRPALPAPTAALDVAPMSPAMSDGMSARMSPPMSPPMSDLAGHPGVADVAPDVRTHVARDVRPDVAPDVASDVRTHVAPDVAPDVAPLSGHVSPAMSGREEDDMSDDTPDTPPASRPPSRGSSATRKSGKKAPRDVAYEAFVKNPQITGAELAVIGKVTSRQGQRWKEQFEATRIHVHKEEAAE